MLVDGDVSEDVSPSGVALVVGGAITVPLLELTVGPEEAFEFDPVSPPEEVPGAPGPQSPPEGGCMLVDPPLLLALVPVEELMPELVPDGGPPFCPPDGGCMPIDPPLELAVLPLEELEVGPPFIPPPGLPFCPPGGGCIMVDPPLPLALEPLDELAFGPLLLPGGPPCGRTVGFPFESTDIATFIVVVSPLESVPVVLRLTV